MSSRRTRDHLEDILKAISYLRSHTEGLTCFDYTQDRKTEAALERELLIISEAAYRLGDEGDALCPDLSWAQIRQIGSVIRHGHHAIDRERIWNTVQRDLTPMQKVVQAALERLP